MKRKLQTKKKRTRMMMTKRRTKRRRRTMRKTTTMRRTTTMRETTTTNFQHAHVLSLVLTCQCMHLI